MSRWMMMLVSGLMLTACAGSYNVTRTSAPAPRAMAVVALAPSADNAKVSGACTASAGLPGSAAGNNGER